MNPEPPDNTYEAWLNHRRQEFDGTDLSFLVMASVRAIPPAPVPGPLRLPCLFSLPSPLVGALRLTLFALLTLTPA